MMNAQERAWAGEHGDEYNRRSPGDEQANLALFKRIFEGVAGGLSGQFKPLSTILELGAGQGANLRALRRFLGGVHLTAVELNQQACEVLHATGSADEVIHASVLDWAPDRTWDLVLTKGLLIHIHPDELPIAYRVIHQAAARWILLCEYYNPTRVSVPYRGRGDLLWKCDFAGELLDQYPDLRLVDYGFVYRRDEHPQDDVTYFLMEKIASKHAAWPFPT
jgi:pseudaminic acid biosynthesis-associated methylase